DGRPRSVDVITLPYPGFPTDLQPQMMAMLSIAGGAGSIVTENVFESRFMFVDELNRMGADIRTEGHHGVIRGVERLSAAPVRALDIRAGAAMVIAALAADGTTEISNVYHLDRGYEGLEEKLVAIGARVRRVKERSPAYTGGRSALRPRAVGRAFPHPPHRPLKPPGPNRCLEWPRS